jgi:predicted small lipoprotein YifL
MTFRVLAAVAILSFALASCGVKNDLVMPDGKPTAKNQKDPSKPPLPIGE